MLPPPPLIDSNDENVVLSNEMSIAFRTDDAEEFDRVPRRVERTCR